MITERQFSPTERASHLAYQFANHKQFTVALVRQQYGMSESGAWRLLNRVSRAIPIVCVDGTWQLMSDADT